MWQSVHVGLVLCSAMTERSAVRVSAGTACLLVVKITAKWGFISPPTLHSKDVKNGTVLDD